MFKHVNMALSTERCPSFPLFPEQKGEQTTAINKTTILFFFCNVDMIKMFYKSSCGLIYERTPLQKPSEYRQE